MGIFNQRVTNQTQTTAQNRYSNPGTVSGAPANSASRVQSYSQGMNFTRGQIIRGEIIDLRNHEVKVQLSGERILTGRIGEPSGLAIGESATFQVTEATSSNVELKLISNQGIQSEEITIDKALEAAGLPKSERNASVVRELLSQGLSVDKNSIQQLLRQSAMFRGVSFHNLALMNKLHIPATEVNASQMEAYMNYEHRIMNLAGQAAMELSDAIAAAASSDPAAALALNQEVLTLLTSPETSPAPLLAAFPADAPLASFALLDADGTLALMDTLEPLGLSGENAAAIVNGSASLRQAASIILGTADRLGTATPAGTDAANAAGDMEENIGTNAAGIMPKEVGDAMAGPGRDVGTDTMAGPGREPEPDISENNRNFATPALGAAPQAEPRISGAGSLFRSLLQGAGSLFGSPQQNQANAPASLLAGQAVKGQSLLPGQMTLADAINNLPALLQTPEVYAILGEYASLARNSMELSSFLPKEMRLELSSQLKGRLPHTVQKKLEDGELTATELLKLLLAQSETETGRDPSYLSSKAYQEILRQMLLARFSMQPEDLQDKDSIPKYYNALDHDLSVLEKIQYRTAMQPAFQDTAANIRDNIDFMKTLNQMFPYLQLPMKLSNQNAHAELYVYTKKEQLQRDPSSISVLLHLDMEQLGPVDIHLDLEKKNLRARFYLPDPVSATVTRDNFSILRQALSAKGYILDARAEERNTNTNLVHDLLDPEKGNHSMKRYTFDIRA